MQAKDFHENGQVVKFAHGGTGFQEAEWKGWGPEAVGGIDTCTWSIGEVLKQKKSVGLGGQIGARNGAER